jgi:hypothetical protein
VTLVDPKDNSAHQLTLIDPSESPNTRETPPCLPGVDSNANRRSYFFGFQSEQAGEKWHVHSPTANVWFFIRSSCATEACVQNGGFKTSGAEHLSFLTTGSGTYWVGINVPNDPDAGLPEILLQHDICGDGTLEHGEACDPKSTPAPAPGSCLECKRVLQTPIEIEPNDSPLDANIIPLSGSNNVFTVDGTVGQTQPRDAGYGNVVGLDPYDFFGLQATDYNNDLGKAVHVDLTWGPVASCDTAYLASVDIGDSWFDASDAVPNCPTCLKSPAPSSPTAGYCTKSVDIPFDPQNAPPNLSSHYIRVAAQTGSQLHYKLALSLRIPGDGG